MSVKTLIELKKEYNNDIDNINNFSDLVDLACNFIRMVTWKKVKDLGYIKLAYNKVISKIIVDIKDIGYNEALKKVKNDNLHKAYNIKYLYNYYGLDYEVAKNELKELKKKIIK